MPLDDAFQSDTDAVLLDMAQRPRPPKRQEPAFSTWGFLKAAPRGAMAGVSQTIGSGADVLEGFSQVLGSLGTEDWLMPDPADAARQTEEARKRLKEQGGPTFNSDVGRSFRNVGRDYMPDPVTSHSAEQAVANLFRVGVKAVAAGATIGPIGGAAVVGAEEGFSTADDLAGQGVDLATRAKVGAVTAAFTTGSLALPVAGQTWKTTTGLALAGGPVSFVGQNAATREILENADYAAIGNQYDPFDPVGLALSTLLPLGFGALAMRGARGAKAADSATAKVDEVTGDIAEPVGPPRPDAEAVDAARVNLLRENIDNTRPTPAHDLPGAVAHETAVSRAIDQMAAGERVSVTDVAPANAIARIADELQPRLARAMDEIAPALRAAEPTPQALAAAAEVVTPPRLEVDVAQGAAVAAERQAEAGAAKEVKLVSESPEVDRAVNLIEADRPDLMVHLDGEDAPVRVADLMKRVREELGRELKEAPLIEAAAACFVSSGS